MEPDPHLRARIHELGVPTHTGLADIADASVDALYSINVLEHIENDLAALREMRRVLRPDGGLLLYVPAFPLLYSTNDRRVGHVRRYRVGPLALLARRDSLPAAAATPIRSGSWPRSHSASGATRMAT